MSADGSQFNFAAEFTKAGSQRLWFHAYLGDDLQAQLAPFKKLIN